MQKAVEKYEKEKEPLVDYLGATQTAVEELVPFGVDVEDGERQVENLKVRPWLISGYEVTKSYEYLKLSMLGP